MKFLNNIDLQNNQVLNQVIEQLGSDPGSPSTGRFWYNTASNLAKYYNGTTNITLYNAASANTASTLVLRDGSGNFTAGIGTFTSITISGTPTASTDGATKGYVDSVAQGLDVKPSANAATTTTLPANTYDNGSSGVGATLTGNSNGAFADVDGYAFSLNDYVLVKNEASGLKNGLYKLTQVGTAGTPYILTRAIEMDTTLEFAGGFCFIQNGTTNGGTGWVCTNAAAPTVGTTAITFTQFSGGATYTATAPVVVSGTVISLAYNARLVNNGGNLDLQASVVTTGTYSAVTVDTYGRVTAGADIITSNGIVTRTSAGNFTNRTITGTSAKITVTNGDGVAGNPTLTIASDYVGQSSITTLGTITTGVWTGTDIAVADGGTGSSTAAGARTNLSAAGLYNGSLTGDGSTVAFTITHSLNNRQAVTQIFDSSYNVVEVDRQNTTVNATVVTFAVAPANSVVYYVTVVG